jgi:branched-chain amino acid aminotransferase
MIKDGKIITPEGRNILRGISRSYVFEIAEQLGIECIEKNIEPYDVYIADEAFLTGTPFCILPTTTLNGINIGDGKMGKITIALLEQWSKNVGLDIVGQIRTWSDEVNQAASSAPTPYQFKRN